MKMWQARIAVLIALLLTSAALAMSAELVLLPAGSFWKYDASGSDLGTNWRMAAFDDAAWFSGPAQLGYGDGDESTVLPYGGDPDDKHLTYYFRHSFNVEDPASVEQLTLRFIRDDGCVIYINGLEVARSNMPSGTVDYTTRASAAIGGANESAWQETPVDPSMLAAGANVIAVEIHQSSPTSSDISFDLELSGAITEDPPPSVTLTSPPHQGVINDPSANFTALASAPGGLESATLYIGGPPRTVVFSGAAQVKDTQLTAGQPAFNDGSGASINVDGQNPHAHGLIKFPTLIGGGSGQVPAGAVITSATLGLHCTNRGDTMRIYRLTEDWVEDEATWNERSNGDAWSSPGADGSGSSASAALNGDCTATGQRSIDLTPFVQEWSSGSPNYGIVLVDSGTDGVDFDSSESGSSPTLTVVYRDDQQPFGTQAISGTSAAVSFPVVLGTNQTYFWNVLVTDVRGQRSWAAADFELTLNAAAPDEPVLVSPSNGSSGVSTSPTLAAAVSDPGGGLLNVTFSGRTATAEEFTIIALPDTQYYSQSFPAVFTAQTEWIVDNRAARNIVFVTHLGDLVQNNDSVPEWQAADASMSILDDEVAYGMGPGNHDQPTTLYNQFFPYTRYLSKSWYGGHYSDKNDNNYELFSAGGIDFLIVHLEFCPPAPVVSWADSVLATYPERTAIITTHGYLGASGQRSVHSCSDTQYLWDDLAAANPNVHFMLSGHVHSEARRSDIANGHPVYQMLSDYQGRPSGGEGWLRILRFVPAEDKVYVQTYSPWLNQYETDADSEFTLDFPMGGNFSPIGAVTVSSGSTASLVWPGLPSYTEQEWRVEVANSSGESRSGPVWSFTSGSGAGTNQPPEAGDQSVDVTEDIAKSIVLGASDPEGNPLTYNIVSGPSHGTLSGSAPDLSYLPAANYYGADSFAFRANDGQEDSNIATVSITVHSVNDAPGATGEEYTLPAGGTLSVAAPGVLGNDSDIEGGALTAEPATGPAHGSLNLNADGSFTYTPAAGYSGPDSFTYNASDGELPSNTVAVSLTVEPVTPPNVTITSPVNGASVTAGTNISFSGTANDAEDGDLTANLVWTSSIAGAIGSGGSFSTPLSVGAHLITASVSDSGGLPGSAMITVTVVVLPPPGLTIEQLVVPGVSNTAWTPVPLSNTYGSMVVVCSPNYDGSSAPLVARVRNTAGNSFDLRLDRADGSADPVAGVPVHCVAVEEGVYNIAEHGAKMEAVKYTSTVTDRAGYWLGESRSYANSYSNPVVTGQVMSANDAAFSVFWARGADRSAPPSSSTLFTGKHVAEDSNQTRADETVGYIVIESGAGTIGGLDYAAATGSDTVLGLGDSPPYSYAIDGLGSVTSAIVSAAAMDGNNGGWPVLYGSSPVTAGSLRLAFDEDQIKDTERNHTTEQVAYIVFGTAPEPSPGPFLERVVIDNVSSSDWTSVSLGHSYNSLVAVCSPNYDDSVPPLVVRMQNASGASFDVRVSRADGSAEPVNGIAVHCMAVEEGIYNEATHGVRMEAVRYTSTVTDHASSWIGESRGYLNAYNSPVVLSQVMTYNEPGFVVFWTRGSSAASPPSSSALYTGKHVGEHPFFARSDETIGYIVIEAGNGTLDGVSYAAGLGADTVRGSTNAPPYDYGLSGLPTVSAAIVSQAAMDGANGGWAVLYGANPVTTASLSLAIDEDQAKDSERRHTTEQVGYIVFE